MAYSESIFFIPVSFDKFDVFSAKIEKSNLWTVTSEENYMPRYFLNYIVNIAKDKSAFRSFSLKNPSSLNLYMFEDKVEFASLPCLTDVRLSYFSTGVGFLEFRISYTDATPENIADFSYRFKKAKVKNINPELNKQSLYDIAVSVLPADPSAKLFFTAATEFKYECHCYHYLHIDEKPDEELSQKWLSLLKRSYNSTFTSSEESDCDMTYKPYENDHWGGSSEGLVNITYDEKNDDSDLYLHQFKYSHLRIDYYFLYLLLLNQRFASIQFITRISKALSGTEKEIEELNHSIVKLKTSFAFNIISDDQIFQNVYSKMYKILGIQSLLNDILDNEGQIEILRNASAAKAENFSSKLLFGISLLSVFSALIDASSYFDRVNKLSEISTELGFIFTCLIIFCCLVWIIKTRNNR